MAQIEAAARRRPGAWRIGLVAGALAGCIAGALDVGTYILAPDFLEYLLVPISLLAGGLASCEQHVIRDPEARVSHVINCLRPRGSRDFLLPG